MEAFGCGTAIFIASVVEIHLRGMDAELLLKKGVEAKFAMTIKSWLRDIIFGVIDHEWGLVVKVLDPELSPVVIGWPALKIDQ